ncbi:hypothetical protein B0H13DRAFT_1179946 [Mycena leptocephala]|nr:hypothetical protein B0H13DRAFT_1179946 [Mycena leptocephala]
MFPRSPQRVLVPLSQSPMPHLSVTPLSTWGSSLSSRHLSHRPQAVPSNPGSARLTSALHSETATERRKHTAVRLRRGWVEARVGRATQLAHGTITMCTSGAEEPRRTSQELRKHAACTRYDYDAHKRRAEGGEHRLLRPVKRQCVRASDATPARVHCGFGCGCVQGGGCRADGGEGAR